MWIATLPLKIIIWLVGKLAQFVVWLSGLLLYWVLSPDFIHYSYTNPAGPHANPIIRMGLSITQGLVNMILVLVLVYIALATILRLAGYETRKLLVSFIFIALIVNFSPVICGLIVDSANILVNFFTSDLSPQNFTDKVGHKIDEVLSNIWSVSNFEGTFGTIIQGIMAIIFLFILAFILNIFTVLFMVRYMVIWLLVILSPLAFAFYILPLTKKYWELWWRQFLNWVFIGVTLSFFLYLGLGLFVLTENPANPAFSSPGTGSISGGGGGLMDYFLPIMAAVLFLALGIIYGLSTAAAGASTVIGFAKRAAGAGVGATRKAGGWTARKALKGMRPTVEKLTHSRQIAGGVANWAQKRRALRWFLPEPLRKYGEYGKAIEDSQPRAKNYSSRTLARRTLSGADLEEHATANVLEVLQRGDAQDLFNEGRGLFGKDLTDEQLLDHAQFQKRMGRAIKIARMGGKHNQILRRDPRLAAIAAATGVKGYGDLKTPAGQPLTGENLKTAGIYKATGEARDHIAQMEPETLLNHDVIRGAMGQWDRDRWLTVSRSVKNGQRYALKTIDSAFSDWIDDKKHQAPKDGAQAEEWWAEFAGKVKEEFGTSAFADALKNDPSRMLGAGWRQGEYIKERGQRFTKPPTPTPGAAAGVPPPPLSQPTPPGRPGVAGSPSTPSVGTQEERVAEAERRVAEGEEKRRARRQPPGRRGVG